MTGVNRGVALSAPVAAALRELVNALSKAAMYPPGHRFIADSAAALIDKLSAATADRDALTIGILPRSLMLDGVPVDPLPAALRDFAMRMHRKNISSIHIRREVTPQELATLLASVSAGNADETVGRDGLRLEHVRVDPISYDVLTLADPLLDRELDDTFWMALVEAAFGRELTDGSALPTPDQIADAISERASHGADGARRVYEALSGFSAALIARDEHIGGSARRRFVEVLAALSRPTTTRVVAAAPSPASRRRFLRQTVELVPPALLLQLLESVAEADGEPISPQLRGLLRKLAGGEEGADAADTGAFSTEVLGLVQQWDGVDDVDDTADSRLSLEPVRLLGLGLELAAASPGVVGAAQRLADGDALPELLRLLDDPQNDAETVRAIADAVLDTDLMARLLAAAEPDFALIERVARQAGAAAVGQLLDALGDASDRSVRRKLLDILVRVGPAAEDALLSRLEGSPWYLARNILAVLAQFPTIRDPAPVLAAMSQPELRVRQEALKVLVRQPAVRERAITEALASGEESLVRMGLTALGSECPPRLVPAVVGILGHPVPDLQVHAIRVLGEANHPLILTPILEMVRARGGFFRRQRLLPKSAVMLAALELLAHRWSAHAQAQAVLQLAAKSNDPDVVAAAGRRA